MNPITVACGFVLLGCSVVHAQLPGVETSPAPSAAPSQAVAPSPSALPVPSDEQQLLAIEQEWSNAYLHGDSEYLARLLTDDFVFTSARAELNNKEEELREVRDRAVHYTVFENHDMTVRIHGDTAVVTGRSRLKGTVSASGKLTETDAQFTSTFARIEGRWRVLAAHVSHAGN